MLAEAKVAVEFKTPVMMDKIGNIVLEIKYMYGLPCKYNLVHPEYFLFIDEVGNNLDCNEDHNIGGEKFIKGVEKDHAKI